MLIAIMGDSYENVTANIRIERFRSLARLSADLLVDFNENDPLFKGYLHICDMKDENAISNRGTWEGRLKAVKNEIGDVRGDIDMLNKKLDTKVEMLNAKLDSLIALLLKKDK